MQGVNESFPASDMLEERCTMKIMITHYILRPSHTSVHNHHMRYKYYLFISTSQINKLRHRDIPGCAQGDTAC